MKEECLICKAPLEYLTRDEMMECTICHKQELSKTRCVEGHYVCSECHTRGMDSILGLCLSETSKAPLDILEKEKEISKETLFEAIENSLMTACKNHFGKALYDMQNAMPEGFEYSGAESFNFWLFVFYLYFIW